MKKTPGKLVTAAIDLGAHSVRMLIAECGGDPDKLDVLEDLSVSIPLGSEVFQHGRIGNGSIRMLCDLFRGFRRKMDEYGVGDCRAIATSAVREAANSEILIERIRHATGIRLKIYEGADEARLNYLIVRKCVPARFGFTRTSSLIADIGTGACQISSYDKGCLRFTETLKVGTLRVLDLMPDTVSAAGLREYLAPVVDKSFGELEHTGLDLHADRLIAMGASVRTLYAIYGGLNKQGKSAVPTASSDGLTYALDRAEFEAKRSVLSTLSIEEISERFDVPPELAEAVIPCSIILGNLFHLTEAKKLLIPMVSMKYGLLRDYFNELLYGRDYFEDQILDMVRTVARKYRCDPEYSGRVEAFAEQLFRKLQPLHGLLPRDLLVLKVAALLHKSGLYINNQAYHKHSAYIIGATEIPGLSLAERKIAALTARYHRKSTPRALHPEFSALDALEKNTVLKLSALLRIACLLASCESTPSELVVKIEPDRVVLRSSETGGSSVRAGVFEDDLDYFAYVFAVPPVIR